MQNSMLMMKLTLHGFQQYYIKREKEQEAERVSRSVRVQPGRKEHIESQ